MALGELAVPLQDERKIGLTQGFAHAQLRDRRRKKVPDLGPCHHGRLAECCRMLVGQNGDVAVIVDLHKIVAQGKQHGMIGVQTELHLAPELGRPVAHGAERRGAPVEGGDEPAHAGRAEGEAVERHGDCHARRTVRPDPVRACARAAKMSSIVSLCSADGSLQAGNIAAPLVKVMPMATAFMKIAREGISTR